MYVLSAQHTHLFWRCYALSNCHNWVAPRALSRQKSQHPVHQRGRRNVDLSVSSTTLNIVQSRFLVQITDTNLLKYTDIPTASRHMQYLATARGTLVVAAPRIESIPHATAMTLILALSKLSSAGRVSMTNFVSLSGCLMP